MSQISFISDAYTLSGNLFTAEKPKKLAFLFIQGWQGHQNIPAAEALASLGFTCMTYDMRGNGESEGKIENFSRADYINDAAVAYDYFREHVGPDILIGVAGSSFGSYTAVLLSEERDVFCLSLRVPASYPDEGYAEAFLSQRDPDNFSKWREEKLEYTQNHAFKALHAFKGKVLIIEAEKDEQVHAQAPKNYADAVADKSQLTYKVMVGAPHRLLNEKLQAEYESILTEWVKNSVNM